MTIQIAMTPTQSALLRHALNLALVRGQYTQGERIALFGIGFDALRAEMLEPTQPIANKAQALIATAQRTANPRDWGRAALDGGAVNASRAGVEIYAFADGSAVRIDGDGMPVEFKGF